jgi:hypothetical protein
MSVAIVTQLVTQRGAAPSVIRQRVDVYRDVPGALPPRRAPISAG